LAQGQNGKAKDGQRGKRQTTQNSVDAYGMPIAPGNWGRERLHRFLHDDSECATI